MKILKVVFMGTPEFSVPCLKSIIEAGHDVCMVFTQPDKPKGRGYVLTPPPVKVEALKNGISVLQPAKMRDNEVISVLKSLNPDVIVVVAYGKILPKEILDLPRYGCINVHASLLPKYRGAAPIQWSIINGEKETGITTMYMDEGLDTGDMLLKETVKIDDFETSGELHDKLSKVGASLLVKTLKKLERGNLIRLKQDDAIASYSPMIKKDMAKIDFSKTAKDIHNLVRGLNPWPIAYTTLRGKMLKIHKTRLSDNCIGEIGEVVSLSPFKICCADNTAIEVLEVQYEGKRKMSIEDFLRGHNIDINTKFGV